METNKGSDSYYFFLFFPAHQDTTDGRSPTTSWCCTLKPRRPQSIQRDAGIGMKERERKREEENKIA